MNNEEQVSMYVNSVHVPGSVMTRQNGKRLLRREAENSKICDGLNFV